MDKLSELCRTCLASSKCLESLDTECEQGFSLKFMLTSFCTLQMDDITVMYDNICKDCSSEILRAYNFKLQCEQNDVLLREKAQSFKYVDVCKRETNYLTEVIDTSIVKKEVENEFYSDENKSNVHVKEEDWMEGDDHRSSDDDDTHNDVDNKVKISTWKKEKKSSKSLEGSSTKVSRLSGSKVKSKCENKRKYTKKSLKETKLVDKSCKKLGYKRVYECPKCGNFCGTFNLIHKHLDKIHSIVLNSVEEFDEMCVLERKARGIQESREEDKDVKVFDTNNPMYKCIECSHRCKEFEAMKKHIIQKHRDPKYIRCSEEDCHFSTHEPRCLVSHLMLKHKNERRFCCDKCDYKTHSKSALESHHTFKHLNIKPFVCHLCSKEFVTKQGLDNHIMMKHEKNTKFFCPTCTKGFYTKRRLKEHVKIHLGLKPHICEHCGMAFTQKANLGKHVFTLHTSGQEDVIQCAECPYKAKNIYNMQSHMRRHNMHRTKVYCDYCGKGFFTKSSLKPHIWKHMGCEPFKCPSCPYTCDSNSHLQRHIMMKHTGERPFQCQFCNYGAISKKLLERHMSSHLNEQKFKCELCPYTANRKDNLTRHLKTKCGTLTRKYTPYKNKAAIDFTQLNMNHLIAEDGGPSTSV